MEQLDIFYLPGIRRSKKFLSLKFAQGLNGYPGMSMDLLLEGLLTPAVPCEHEGLIIPQGHLLCWNIDILVNIFVFW